MRCFACGDSTKSKTKKRGYLYEKEDSFFYNCFNCGFSCNFNTFLEYLNPTLYRDYKLEAFGKPQRKPESNTHIQFKKPVFYERLETLDSIAELPEAHYVRQYIQCRKIPREFFQRLYFAPDFKLFIDELIPEHGKELVMYDPRIIIPFYDSSRQLIAIQGRAMTARTKYITIKIDNESPKIFGLDRFDKTKKGYICEGPFDSFFLTNSLAVAGASMSEVDKYTDKKITTVVYDNEARNKDIVNQMLKVIDLGFNLFVWPDNLPYKDINETIMGGYSSSQIMSIIDQNTFSGLEADLQLTQWRKS